MPDVIVGAPEVRTYRYVLFHPGKPRNQTYTVSMYGLNTRTRIVRVPDGWDLDQFHTGNPNNPTDKDRRVVAAFVDAAHLRDRCIRQGFIEVTERWFESLGHPGGGPLPGVPVGEAPPPPASLPDPVTAPNDQGQSRRGGSRRAASKGTPS